MNTHNRSGFTLMEMLLVTVLVSMVGLSVFQSFSNGLKLWAWGTQIDREGDVAIAMDKLGEDLRSTLAFSIIPFKGTALRLSFASIVTAPADHNSSRAQEEFVDQIGAIEYYFDPGSGTLFKRQANYGQALKDRWGPASVVLDHVAEMNFHYHYLDGKKLLSRTEADHGIPVGVTVEISVQSRPNERLIKRYCAIPMGG